MSLIHPYVFRAKAERARLSKYLQWTDMEVFRSLVLGFGLLVSQVGSPTSGGPGGVVYWMFGFWLLALTLEALSVGTPVYVRERDLKTLELLVLTPMSPRKEIMGRFWVLFKPLARAWLAGLAWPVLFYLKWGLLGEALVRWVFVLPWLAGWSALGLWSSVCAPDVPSAFVKLVGVFFRWSVLALVLQIPGWTGDLSRYGFSFTGWNNLSVLLPLNLNAFLLMPHLVDGSFRQYDAQVPGAYLGMLLTLGTWTYFAKHTLDRAADLIAAGEHCTPRVGDQAKSQGAVTSPQPVRPGPSLEVARTSAAIRNADEAFLKTAGRPQAGLLRLLSTCNAALMRPFDVNPVYRARRPASPVCLDGTQPTLTLGTGFMILWLVVAMVSTCCCSADSTTLLGEARFLSCLAVPAWFLTLSDGFQRGKADLLGERDRTTWPVLVGSGMDPRTVLVGKVAALFYSFCGEFVLLMPMWLVLITLRPLFALLIVVQPVAFVLGIVWGMLAVGPRQVKVRCFLGGCGLAYFALVSRLGWWKGLSVLLAHILAWQVEPTLGNLVTPCVGLVLFVWASWLCALQMYYDLFYDPSKLGA